MLPSAAMISQITATGRQPASRISSMAASVCPGRARTPPGSAMIGNMWPGRAKSPARASGSASATMVAARSAAEMPVVVPCR